MQSKISSGFYGLRRKQLSLTVIAVVCTTLLVWGWEKTPLASTFLLEQWQLETLPAAAKPASPSQQPINASWQVKTSAAVVSPEPAGSPSIITPVNASQPEAPSIIPISKEKNAVLAGCNYARGRWVRDARRRPLYSGFGCKRWLSPMWACRLTRRTDFSYESFRWQPESCEMQEFDRHSLLTRLQGKTIALVGDSLGRQQFQSLMCMLTGGEEAAEVDDVGREFGLVKAPGAIRPDGWAYRFPATNTTVLYYWSASLCELEPLNRSNPAATRYAMHLDRPAAFLRRHIGRFDVLVLNTGHHWNRGKISGNRWDMYVGGAPLRDRRMAEIYRAKNFTVHSVVRWVDSQLPHHPRLRAFLRSISPRHFVNGDWNSGGSCANTTPLLRGARVRDGGTTDDALAAAAVAGTGVRLLDITAPSELRDEAHMSNYSLRTSASGVHDCLHWCLPGVPDTWNEILLAQL